MARSTLASFVLLVIILTSLNEATSTMTSEEVAKNSVITWLSQNDFVLRNIAATRGRPAIAKRRGRPRRVKPPDLIAKRRNQNYYYFVEVKGDPPSTTKFYQVWGEIAIQMARKTPAAYAIALPISFKQTILDLLSLRSWKKTGFRILVVRQRDVVELRPSVQAFDSLGRL